MPEPSPRGPDRRRTQRRDEDQRLHLARELVIEKTRMLVADYTSKGSLTAPQIEDYVIELAELVDVLETAEQT